MEDDHREQFCWKVEVQWDRLERFNLCTEWSERFCSAKEEHWEVKIDVTAVGRRTSGFFLTRFEVGRDGREACEGTRHVFRRRNLGVDKQEASSES